MNGRVSATNFSVGGIGSGEGGGGAGAAIVGVGATVGAADGVGDADGAAVGACTGLVVLLAVDDERVAAWVAIAAPLSILPAADLVPPRDPRPALLLVPEHDQFRTPASAAELTAVDRAIEPMLRLVEDAE